MPFARSFAILSLLLLVAPAGAVTEADFCGAGEDPCEFNGKDALNIAENTTLDFGGRTLIIGYTRKINITGGIKLEITAGSFVMRPGARIGNAQTATGAALTVTTTGDIVMEQAIIESRSRVEFPGTITGGNIQFTAGGDMDIAGELRANGVAADASGGVIDLEAGGKVTLSGPVNAAGDIAGVGGEFDVGADGPIVVNGPVDCSGGLEGGGIDLTSSASVSTTAFLDARGSVGGSGGGTVAIVADGSITLGNKIFAQGVGTIAGGGGFGGEVDLEAPGGSLVINDSIDLSGGAPEGIGGEAFFQAGADIFQKDPIFAFGSGTGGNGGDVTYDAGHLVSLEALNDVSGSDFGGTFSASARGEVQAKNDVVVSATGVGGSAGTIDLDGFVPGVAQVSGDITVTGALRAIGDTDGGGITLQGCDVTIPAGGVLNNAGNKSANTVNASGLMTIGGRLLASPAPAGSNVLQFRDADKQPILTGAVIDPATTPQRKGDLPGCQPPKPRVCGDGEIEVGETCDDGNLTDCDGCSGSANGMSCAVAADCCQEEACGNGKTECGEQCDDGNVVDNDGCDADCTSTRCGNGRTTGAEECDDGNNVNGDGCNELCITESPKGCGDGDVSDNEECDDKNQQSCDGCSKLCTREGCGNGVRECGEVCDDGGTLPCDGQCSADCTRLADVCGDGSEPECGEQCDKGANPGVPGSGCSVTCQTCTIGSGTDCPCGTNIDCAPTGVCAGVACLSGACSSVNPPGCKPNDGNDCNGIETCDGNTGACAVLPAPPCPDDGDPCTDDACSPAAGGCARPRRTGLPGISCRLDFIDTAATNAAIADLANNLRAKILQLSGNARARLASAGEETVVKRQRKLLKASEKQLKKLVGVISKGLKSKKHLVSETLGKSLREQADGALSAARTLRAGLTG